MRLCGLHCCVELGTLFYGHHRSKIYTRLWRARPATWVSIVLRFRLKSAAAPTAAHPCWSMIIRQAGPMRSEEHTSELQSLMRISYAVFCLKKKNKTDLYILEVDSIDNSESVDNKSTGTTACITTSPNN